MTWGSEAVRDRKSKCKDILLWDDIYDTEFIEELYRTLNNTVYDSPAFETAYRSWSLPFSIEDFSKHRLFLGAQKRLQKDLQGHQFECISAEARVITFGDFITLDEPVIEPNHFGMIYFANPIWQEAWAGETIFFSEGDTVNSAIAPRPGRVCFYPLSLKRRLGVPSRLTHHSLLIVQMVVRQT